MRASHTEVLADNIVRACCPVSPEDVLKKSCLDLEKPEALAADALQQVRAANLAEFPAELKALPRWVCWKYENRNGKVTKVLYNPITHRRASSTDSSTWAEYAAAVNAVSKRDYAGVGCVIADPYAAVDLDKCRDSATGVVEPWAAAIVTELNSYTELSPSGCGFHIWIKGSVPTGGNRKGRIEMYDCARYFTVTGDHFAGTPVTIESRDLTSLHTRMLADMPEIAPPTSSAKPSRDDLVAGRWQGYYRSQSEADLALCVLLAEGCGGKADMIDAAFRASALFRSKWDEKHGSNSYGGRTIERAIELWRKNGAICIVEEEPKASAPTVPVYPTEALDGDYIGELTRLLTNGTSIPPQFTRENVKCILGAIIDGAVGFPGQEDLHTRHYLINVSLHTRTGKGRAWNRTGEYPEGVLHGLLSHCGIKVIDGGLFGSGEYMTKTLCDLERNGCPSHVLARFDEMYEVFEKAKATGSTLESKLLQLYERNSIASGSFKNGEHSLTDTHLSLSGDFVRSKFQETFEGRGSGGSGLLPRCTLSFADKVFHSGDWVARDNIAITKALTAIECAADTLTHLKDRLVPEESDAARKMRWEFFDRLRSNEDPRYTPELEAHFKRDLLMRVLFSREARIDAERTQKSVAWTLYQLEVRKELWPEDAGGPVERMEQKVVKALTGKGSLSLARLIDFCHVSRGGSGGREAFNRAMKALTLSQELTVVGKTQRGAPVYALCNH
jgi:putative DNA primase/helicase